MTKRTAKLRRKDRLGVLLPPRGQRTLHVVKAWLPRKYVLRKREKCPIGMLRDPRLDLAFPRSPAFCGCRKKNGGVRHHAYPCRRQGNRAVKSCRKTIHWERLHRVLQEERSAHLPDLGSSGCLGEPRDGTEKPAKRLFDPVSRHQPQRPNQRVEQFKIRHIFLYVYAAQAQNTGDLPLPHQFCDIRDRSHRRPSLPSVFLYCITKPRSRQSKARKRKQNYNFLQIV